MVACFDHLWPHLTLPGQTPYIFNMIFGMFGVDLEKWFQSNPASISSNGPKLAYFTAMWPVQGPAFKRTLLLPSWKSPESHIWTCVVCFLSEVRWDWTMEHTHEQRRYKQMHVSLHCSLPPNSHVLLYVSMCTGFQETQNKWKLRAMQIKYTVSVLLLQLNPTRLCFLFEPELLPKDRKTMVLQETWTTKELYHILFYTSSGY